MSRPGWCHRGSGAKPCVWNGNDMLTSARRTAPIPRQHGQENANSRPNSSCIDSHSANGAIQLSTRQLFCTQRGFWPLRHFWTRSHAVAVFFCEEKSALFLSIMGDFHYCFAYVLAINFSFSMMKRSWVPSPISPASS